MNKEIQPQRHEFWLRKYSERYEGIDETLPVYRVALGELIDASQRKTFDPSGGLDSLSVPPNADLWNKSGAVGFMDIKVERQIVPKEGAVPYPGVEHEYLMQDCEEKETLVITRVGIEPEYQKKGYARLLAQRAAEIASEWRLDTIVADMIENPVVKDWATRLGGVLYDGGSRAVIRIRAGS